MIGSMKVRVAELDDNRDFGNLLSNLGGQTLFRAWFGAFNYPNIIEYSCLTLIAHNEEDTSRECVGFLSLNDSITCSDIYNFENTLQYLKRFLDCKTTNTLFVNFWALDHKFPTHREAGFELLRNAYIKYSELEHIVWLCPSNAKAPEFITILFTEIDFRSSSSTEDDYTRKGHPLQPYKVYTLHRTKLLPQLLVRDALVEDNDDLLPILRNYSTIYTEDSYDDFFLAKLIESQDSHNRFFVCVNELQRPSGMLATSLDVNVELINKVFDLSSFSDVIIQSGEKPPIKCIVSLIVGYPVLLKSVSIAAIAKDIGVEYIDVSELIQRVKSEGDMIEKDIVNAIYIEIKSLAALAENTESRIQSIVLYGFPRTEMEALTLLQSEIILDAVIEVVPDSEDADIDDEDFPEDLEDALECLRNEIGPRDAAYDVDAAEGGGGSVRCMWRRLALEDDDSSAVSDEITSELRDAFNALQRITFQHREGDEDGHIANAFVITIYCIDNRFSSRSEDLLRMAFEEHPTLDYCLIMLPNKSPPSQLTRWMCPVKPRLGISFDQTLYIIHRDALLAIDNLSVSRLAHAHENEVDAFLAPLQDDFRVVKEAFLNSLNHAELEMKDNPSEIAIGVFLAQEMVGLALLSRECTTEDDVSWMRANYLLDEVINLNKHSNRAQAMITHWILNPIYSRWSRFVMRDIMRLYQKSLLFYQSSVALNAPAEIIHDMVPVLPRQRTPVREFGGEDVLLERPNPYANGRASPLFCLTKRGLMKEKLVIGTRVVVVGGGSSTFSVLEKLCFAPNIHMPNIFLVLERAPDPWIRRGGDDFDENDTTKCLAGCLSPLVADEPPMQELYALGLANRVSLIRGRLRDLDRENRAIVLWNDIAVEYDILILSTGMQDASFRSFPSFSKMHPRNCAEYGLFGLGCVETEAAALRWLRRKSRPETGVENDDVIIFGCGIEALAAVTNLIENGVEATRMTWIIPKKPTAELGNDVIDELVSKAFENSDITILHNHKVVDVGRSASGFVESVTIVSCSSRSAVSKEDDEREILTCCALLTCNQYLCTMDTFTAVNESGLVYDGGVVVDKDFRTADHCIYALGSFTRFSRVMKNPLPHSSFNPRELGELAASRILSLEAASLKHPGLFASSDGSNGLLKMIHPRTIYVQLVDSLRYVRSVLPGEYKDNTPYVTGDVSSDSVCSLQVSHLGVVVEIVALSTANIQVRNISCAVGLHESYLNGAVFAYDSAQVSDWLEYLQRDWMSAICDDKFLSFVDSIRAQLAKDAGTQHFVETVLELVASGQEDIVITGERRRLIGDRGLYISDESRRLIESHTLEFLKKNKMLLSKFNVPNMTSNPSNTNKK